MRIDEVTFSELIERTIDNRGRTCPTSEYGWPLIATNCIKDDSLYPVYERVRYVSEEVHRTWFRGHPEPGDILFVNKATPGRTALVPDPIDFCVAQDMIAIRANKERIYPAYLFAALRSSIVRRRIENMHVGTMIPHFKKGDFNKISIPVPRERKHQEFIGDLYLRLSKKIDLNRRMATTLQEMVQAIFKSWFIDFDPVRAKVEGRPTKLPIKIDALFPESLEDSELGPIPRGWKIGCVDDDFTLTMGQSPPGSTYNQNGEGLPFYQGRSDFGFRFPTHRVYCTAPTRVANAGDTLISVRAPVGDINMADEVCAIGRGVASARHRTGSRSYTYYFMRSIEAVFETFESEGTVFGAIGKKDFHAIKCCLPPRDLVEHFESLVGPLDEKELVLEKETSILATIRDSLLPKLITGEITVQTALSEERP